MMALVSSYCRENLTYVIEEEGWIFWGVQEVLEDRTLKLPSWIKRITPIRDGEILTDRRGMGVIWTLFPQAYEQHGTDHPYGVGTFSKHSFRQLPRLTRDLRTCLPGTNDHFKIFSKCKQHPNSATEQMPKLNTMLSPQATCLSTLV